MKPIESKSLSRNAVILACIIGAVCLIINIPFLRLPRQLYLTIRYIFPHEVFGNISRLLLIPLRSPFLAGFPWFSFVPARQDNGILGLIDGFVMARKPSLTLLILQLVILLGYAGWSGFQIRQLYRFDKKMLEAEADAIS